MVTLTDVLHLNKGKEIHSMFWENILFSIAKKDNLFSWENIIKHANAYLLYKCIH